MLPPSDRGDPARDGWRASGDTGDTAVRDEGVLRFDALRTKSIHNAYERDEGLFDQLAFHHARSLELDLHVDGGSRWPARARDWYVYHSDPGDRTSCVRLSDCLQALGAFHAARPDHAPITVFLDLKSDWTPAGQAPADLDAAIRARFGPEALFEPADLLAACPGARTLREAVTGACAWPAVDDLAGTVAFVLTGGAACGGKLSAYASGGVTAGTRAAFVASEPVGACDVDHQPTFAPFTNLPPASAALAARARGIGAIARIWDVNDDDAWDDGVAAGAGFLATDKVNAAADPWADTVTGDGWPSQCLEPDCDAPLAEPGEPGAWRVRSGDQWGRADDMVLFSETFAATDRTTATASVSVASSHVQEWAKGCLVARGSTDADAASFAVCRPADVHVARVQIRAARGASTTNVEHAVNPPDTNDDDTAPFLRLLVEPSGAGAKATGQASLDGVAWTTIASATFPVPLPVRGVGLSGHGEEVAFVVGGYRRSVGTGAAVATDLGALAQRRLGSATVTRVPGAP